MLPQNFQHEGMFSVSLLFQSNAFQLNYSYMYFAYETRSNSFGNNIHMNCTRTLHNATTPHVFIVKRRQQNRNKGLY